MTANEFDFFGVVAGGGFDEFDAVVVDDAERDGGNIALVLVAGEEELLVALLDADFLMLKADAVMVGFEEGDDGGEDFEEVGGGGYFAGADGLEEAVGGDGGGAGSEAAGGPGEAAGVTGMFFDEEEGFLFFEPALEAGGAPVGKVAMGDGLAGELVGEDFLDGGEFVEPGEDEGAGLAVIEAAVELLADGVGKAGNFADEGTLCIHKILVFSFEC